MYKSVRLTIAKINDTVKHTLPLLSLELLLSMTLWLLTTLPSKVPNTRTLLALRLHSTTTGYIAYKLGNASETYTDDSLSQWGRCGHREIRILDARSKFTCDDCWHHFVSCHLWPHVNVGEVDAPPCGWYRHRCLGLACRVRICASEEDQGDLTV